MNKKTIITQVLLLVIITTVTIYLMVSYETSEEKVEKPFPKFILPLVYGEEYQIPEWVKGVASFWVEGNISDTEFGDAIKFLLEHEIIIIDGYGKIVEKYMVVEDYELKVTTDKESYVRDAIMMVSGTLPDYGSSSVTFMLTDPNNMIMFMKSVISDGDGTYSMDVKLGSDIMKESGTYTLTANYKGEKVQTTIKYSVAD